MLAHFLALLLLYGASPATSAADSIISITILAGMSVGLWFWVGISDFEAAKPLGIILNHIGVATISIAGYVLLSSQIINYLFTLYPDFGQGSSLSIPSRAVTGGLIYVIVIVVFYLIVYVRNYRERVSREAELRALVKEAELNWLKLQVNPHFLFNSLNSVSSLTLTSPTRAQEMIIRLSELLRYSLNLSPDSLVALEQEVDCCRKYLDIERVRFGNRLCYSIEVDPACGGVKVPGMVIQPLFENAIKHGAAQQVEECLVQANIFPVARGLSIKVSNTLSGHPFSIKSTGVGLENIRRRLQLIYGATNLLTVENSGERFTATIIIPQSGC